MIEVPTAAVAVPAERVEVREAPAARVPDALAPIMALSAEEKIALFTVGNARIAYATSLWNSSGSMLPPDRTATTTLPFTSSRPASSAARPIAPPGSTTSFSSRNANATARPASASVAAIPSPISSRLISKVILPGVFDISASQIEPDRRALCSCLPLRNERAVSSKPSGSAVKIFTAGARALRASEMPAASPPPEAPITATSGVTPSAVRSSMISRPAVPWPAMMKGSS